MARRSKVAAAQLGPIPRDSIVGMMICNDRRWPESCRVGSQGAELSLLGPIAAQTGVVPRSLD
jgi:hypothetical protein